MALMLRYLGIPARVAAGFTSGNYVRSAGEWRVTDHDAHTWVEAWFPHYGWVTFDPTPPAAPALGGRCSINSNGILGGSGGLSKLGGRNAGLPGGAVAGGARTHSSGSATQR